MFTQLQAYGCLFKPTADLLWPLSAVGSWSLPELCLALCSFFPAVWEGPYRFKTNTQCSIVVQASSLNNFVIARSNLWPKRTVSPCPVFLQLAQYWYHCLLLGRHDSQQEDTRNPGLPQEPPLCCIFFWKKHGLEASFPQTPLLVYEMYHVAQVGFHCATGPLVGCCWNHSICWSSAFTAASHVSKYRHGMAVWEKYLQREAHTLNPTW